VKSRRERVLVAGVLLAGLGWVFWPFLVTPARMEGFCGALPAGATLVQVQALATERGYRLSPLADGRAIVHEPRSFGRFTCELRFGPTGLASATYAFND
jgi:hypothetical protein